jgi:hypothetical protein
MNEEFLGYSTCEVPRPLLSNSHILIIQNLY